MTVSKCTNPRLHVSWRRRQCSSLLVTCHYRNTMVIYIIYYNIPGLFQTPSLRDSQSVLGLLRKRNPNLYNRQPLGNCWFGMGKPNTLATSCYDEKVEEVHHDPNSQSVLALIAKCHHGPNCQSVFSKPGAPWKEMYLASVGHQRVFTRLVPRHQAPESVQPILARP